MSNPFFDHPILNPPYEYPSRHWELDEFGQPTPGANEGAMPGNTENSNEEIQELIRAKIENLRPRLLDLSRRNPLISTRFSPRSNSHIRVVDELPDALSFFLSDQQTMRFVPLPPLDEDPKDEQTRQFQDALANARLTDETYLAAVDEIV